MSTEWDLKQLWKQQASSMPGIEHLRAAVKVYQNRELRKIVIANLLLLATIALIAAICLSGSWTMVTTPIGAGIIITAIAGYLFFYNRLYPSLWRLNKADNSTGFLQRLIALQKKQARLSGIALSLYFVFLALGLALAMVEPTSKMPPGGDLFAYGATAAWLLFAWFKLRPRTLKKEQERMAALIHRLEQLERQFEAEA